MSFRLLYNVLKRVNSPDVYFGNEKRRYAKCFACSSLSSRLLRKNRPVKNLNFPDVRQGDMLMI